MARFECEVRVESERRPSRPRATTRERESVLALSSAGLATASWPRERVRARGETSPRLARDAGGAHAGLYSVQALYRLAGQECARRPMDMATALDGHVLVHGENTFFRVTVFYPVSVCYAIVDLDRDWLQRGWPRPCWGASGWKVVKRKVRPVEEGVSTIA